jgi:hypothetical protein
MFSALDGFRSVLSRDRGVVLAELRAGHGDRAALLSTMEHCDTEWAL